MKDSDPAPGQICEVCKGPDHLWCQETTDSAAALFTMLHGVVGGQPSELDYLRDVEWAVREALHAHEQWDLTRSLAAEELWASKRNALAELVKRR